MCKSAIADGFLDEKNNKRIFECISPLQYAAWGFDVPMLYWQLLYWSLTYVPKDLKAKTLQWAGSITTTYSLKLLQTKLNECLQYAPVDEITEISNHLQELEDHGTEYGAHYQYQSLINVLQTLDTKADDLFKFEHASRCNRQFDNLRSERESKQQVIRDYFLKEVRDSERQTILQLVHVYCSNAPTRGVGGLEFKDFDLVELPHTEGVVMDLADYFLNHHSVPRISWRNAIADNTFLNFAVLRGGSADMAYLIQQDPDDQTWLSERDPNDFSRHSADTLVGAQRLFERSTAQFKELVAQLQAMKLAPVRKPK